MSAETHVMMERTVGLGSMCVCHRQVVFSQIFPPARSSQYMINSLQCPNFAITGVCEWWLLQCEVVLQSRAAPASSMLHILYPFTSSQICPQPAAGYPIMETGNGGEQLAWLGSTATKCTRRCCQSSPINTSSTTLFEPSTYLCTLEQHGTVEKPIRALKGELQMFGFLDFCSLWAGWLWWCKLLVSQSSGTKKTCLTCLILPLL